LRIKAIAKQNDKSAWRFFCAIKLFYYLYIGFLFKKEMKRFYTLAFLAMAVLVSCLSPKKAQPSTGEQMLEMLNKQGLSLLVYNNEILTTHDNRGIQDLLTLVASQPERLKGAIVADKIIGKAAAALMTSCGVVEVHTNIICTPAREIFEKAGIKIFAAKEVPLILNREKSGMCPMDTRIQGIESVEECVEILQNIPRVL
jgi:iron complex outermembrane receptor protein